jgi:putative flippase GtrA
MAALHPDKRSPDEIYAKMTAVAAVFAVVSDTQKSRTWWLNRHFTFREASHAAAATQWARFLAVNAIGFCANYLTFATLVATLPLAATYAVLAVPAGSLVGLCFNFLLSKKFAFVSQDQHRIRLQNTD